jgi:hypothetical protein
MKENAKEGMKGKRKKRWRKQRRSGKIALKK